MTLPARPTDPARSTMTGAELCRLLDGAGLSVQSAADLLGVRVTSLNKWRSGRNTIPEAVAVWLRRYAGLADDLAARERAWLATHPRPPAPPREP